jgi:glycosyltransferase involved in cell wall biosynthesis
VDRVSPCVLIPIHDHGATIAEVVKGLAPAELPCLLVDDGSGPATREAIARVAREHAFVEVLRRACNGGKGAALKDGYRAALARGFSHAVQLDADGQHDPADVPRFVATIEARPDALVLGVPVFDESAPLARLLARQLSRGLVWLACLSREVPDPLCGYRAVPLAPTVAILDRVRTGNWMDFDPELAVRLVWEGVPVACLPTRVVYHAGGLSHFSLLRDYPRLAWLYTRLAAGMTARAPALRRRAREAGGAG